MPTIPERWRRGLAAGLLLATVLIAYACHDRLDVARLVAWVEQAGPAGPALFIAGYALATVLFLPGSVLTLAGGVLFGALWGTLYNLLGATVGALCAFLIARHLAAEPVRRRLAKAPGGRIDRLMRGVDAEGWRFVAFTRLVPLFPFNLLNYALGLTRIPVVHFVAASFVFMLPGATAYTYLGFAGREAVAGSEGLIRTGLIALALLATAAFLPRLVMRMRNRSGA